MQARFRALPRGQCIGTAESSGAGTRIILFDEIAGHRWRMQVENKAVISGQSYFD